MRTPANYNGSHTPANLTNQLGACLADATYLRNELPKGTRNHRAAVSLTEKLNWCISLHAEQEKKRETKAQP